MKFSCLQFDQNFELWNRFVFLGPKRGGFGGDTASETPEEPPEAKDREAEAKDKEGAKAETKELTKAKQEALAEKLGEGEAKEYVGTFSKFMKTGEYHTLAALLESGIESGDPGVIFNFEQWSTMENTPKIAEFFDSNPFPRTKGYNEFIRGLQIGPKENTDKSSDAKAFRTSHRALRDIVNLLEKNFEDRRATRVDTAANKEKPPLGETVSSACNNAFTEFKRMDGMGKTVMLGAGIITLVFLKKFGDTKIWGEKKVKDIAWWGAGILAANYMVGKFSKDGRTLIQRLDIWSDVDDLKDDNKLKAFALDHGMRENQDVLRTAIHLQDRPVKNLFDAYREAGRPGGTHSIDPRELGFHKNEVDGEDAYEVMKGLAQITSINFHTEKYQKEWERLSPEEKEKRPRKPSTDMLARWSSKGIADAAFEEKYVNGELGKYDIKVIDAIFNEYHTRNLQEVIQRGKDGRIFSIAGEKIKQGAKYVAGKAKEYGPKTGNWFLERGKDIYSAARENIFAPMGGFVAARWNKYFPKAKEAVLDFTGIRDRESAYERSLLNKVLPASFAADVPENGKATIMGIPGIPLETGLNPDGKDTIKIDGIEFIQNAGLTGNAKERVSLEDKMNNKAHSFLIEASKENQALEGKAPHWNPREKMWEVANVEIKPGGVTATLVMTVDTDGKTARFSLNGKEIDNFQNLETIYRDAEIQKKIWEDSRFGKHLNGLPITVKDIKSDPTHGTVIEGTIAGLEFRARDSLSVTGSFDFLDASGNPGDPMTGGAELLVITKDKGGEEFLNALAAQKALQDDFKSAFFELESLMDNTSEGVFARLGEVFPTTRLWIIPTSFNAKGINGKILQRQWKYVLDFKKMETLDLFTSDIEDGTVADIETSYATHITNALKQIRNLSRDIKAVRTDEEKANRFQEFLTGHGNVPGLENINTTNNVIAEMLDEYRKAITADRLNYAGAETFGDISGGSGDSSWGAADEAYECYQVLLSAWSYHTRKFAHTAPSASDIPLIRNGLIDKVSGILEQSQGASGKIHLADLQERLKAAGLMPQEWGKSTYLDTYNGSSYEAREMRDMTVAINPTDEVLDGLPGDDGSKPEHGIRAKLKKIMQEVFPQRYASKFSNEVTDQYVFILQKIPDFIMYQAITENGSEEELLDRFRAELEKIRNKASDRVEVSGRIRQFFRWLVDDKTWHLKGENPHLQNHHIKPRHKTAISNELKKLEEYYEDRLKDIHEHWYGDSFDSNKLEFLNETEMAFHREYHLNMAIVYNQLPGKFVDEYSNFLRDAYRDSIKDPQKKGEQESEDKLNEERQRDTDIRWNAIKQAVINHAST